MTEKNEPDIQTKLERNLQEIQKSMVLPVLVSLGIISVLLCILVFSITISLPYGYTSNDFNFNLLITGFGFFIPLVGMLNISLYNSRIEDNIKENDQIRKIQTKKILALSLLTIPLLYLEMYHLWIIYFLNPYLTSVMFAIPIIFNVVLIGLIGFKTLDLKFEVLFLFSTVTLFTTATWSLLLMTGGVDGFRVWPAFMISYVVAGILGILVWIIKKTPRN